MLPIYLSAIDDISYREKFEDIYMRYRKQMFFMAKSILRTDEDSEDAVHTVFLMIAKKYMPTVARIENDTDMRNYLLTAVKNTSFNILKQKKRAVPIENILFSDVNGNLSDEEFIEKINTSFEYERILRALEKLGDTYKQTLYYYFVLDMSAKETAKHLNLSLSAVKKQITRGKSLLLTELNGRNTND